METESSSDRAGDYAAASRDRGRTVLVAVLNNVDDFRRAQEEGWYRIPQRRAPRRIGADFLAFYQTAAFRAQGEDNRITWYAPTRRYRLVTRRDLLPQEADHARAADYYYRIDIGPLQRLERPLAAASFRRVTFIHTTLDRLLSSREIVELFRHDDPFDTLWDALREHNLRPLKNRLVGDAPVDITLRARNGHLGINCREDTAAQESRPVLLPERWELLNLAGSHVTRDLEGCLRRIGAALIGLGGSVLNA